MANKIIKGLMKWLLDGKTLKDNIETEIAVPEEYFGANRELTNLDIGGKDGQALVKKGAGVELVDLPSGGGDSGIEKWAQDKSYPAAALICKDNGEKVRYWQARKKNTGKDPETSADDWQEIDFAGTFLLPQKIEINLSEENKNEKQ